MSQEVIIKFIPSETNPDEEFTISLELPKPDADRRATGAERAAVAIRHAIGQPGVMESMVALMDAAMDAMDNEKDGD